MQSSEVVLQEGGGLRGHTSKIDKEGSQINKKGFATFQALQKRRKVTLLASTQPKNASDPGK